MEYAQIVHSGARSVTVQVCVWCARLAIRYLLAPSLASCASPPWKDASSALIRPLAKRACLATTWTRAPINANCVLILWWPVSTATQAYYAHTARMDSIYQLQTHVVHAPMPWWDASCVTHRRCAYLVSSVCIWTATTAIHASLVCPAACTALISIRVCSAMPDTTYQQLCARTVRRILLDVWPATRVPSACSAGEGTTWMQLLSCALRAPTKDAKYAKRVIPWSAWSAMPGTTWTAPSTIASCAAHRSRAVWSVSIPPGARTVILAISWMHCISANCARLLSTGVAGAHPQPHVCSVNRATTSTPTILVGSANYKCPAAHTASTLRHASLATMATTRMHYRSARTVPPSRAACPALILLTASTARPRISCSSVTTSATHAMYCKAAMHVHPTGHAPYAQGATSSMITSYARLWGYKHMRRLMILS